MLDEAERVIDENTVTVAGNTTKVGDGVASTLSLSAQQA